MSLNFKRNVPFMLFFVSVVAFLTLAVGNVPIVAY